MGAQIRRFLSLTIAGFMMVSEGAVTEASTISGVRNDVGTDIEEQSENVPAYDDIKELVEQEIRGDAANAAAPPVDDTGPDDTGPDESSQKEEIEITTNEDGRKVYNLLSDVSECIKVEMTEGETVYIEGNGYTIQTNDNGIYASGNGTLVVSDVTVLGGDNTSAIGVLDGEVNLTFSGNVAVQELYFGGNELAIDDNSNLILYGRGAQVQSLYYAGQSFKEGENAHLSLFQSSFEDSKTMTDVNHVIIAYGNGIDSVEYITDQDSIEAYVVLPLLSVKEHIFKGWYSDGRFKQQYDQNQTIKDGMVIYAKYANSAGNAQQFSEEEVAEEEQHAADDARIAIKDAVVDSQLSGVSQITVTDFPPEEIDSESTKEAIDRGELSDSGATETEDNLTETEIESSDKDHTDSEGNVSENNDIMAADEAVSSVESNAGEILNDDFGNVLYIEEESPVDNTGQGYDSAGSL